VSDADCRGNKLEIVEMEDDKERLQEFHILNKWRGTKLVSGGRVATSFSPVATTNVDSSAATITTASVTSMKELRIALKL
jgi:hypothetical protein